MWRNFCILVNSLKMRNRQVLEMKSTKDVGSMNVELSLAKKLMFMNFLLTTKLNGMYMGRHMLGTEDGA
jgi:hypothetical protein